jgi:hypothetical protein
MIKCPICHKQYQRQTALDNHMKNVNEANKQKPGVYSLPPEAIAEAKMTIVYEIKNKLKQHAKHTGSCRVKVNCTESEFFWIFSGNIHQYNPKSGRYKCIFRGEEAYDVLSQIFNDTNWGVKYFGYSQRTFVLTHMPHQDINDLDPLSNVDIEIEKDPLQEPNSTIDLKKKRRSKPIQVTIEWRKKTVLDAQNIVNFIGYVLIFFIVSWKREN